MRLEGAEIGVARKPMTALIVEDNESISYIYAQALLKLGFEVVEAPNGRQALEYLEDHVPALVILDMLLPGVSGLEVRDYIYSAPHLKDTHLFIATAHEEFKKLPRRPGDRFLLKPFTGRDLSAAVTKVMAAAA